MIQVGALSAFTFRWSCNDMHSANLRVLVIDREIVGVCMMLVYLGSPNRSDWCRTLQRRTLSLHSMSRHLDRCIHHDADWLASSTSSAKTRACYPCLYFALRYFVLDSFLFEHRYQHFHSWMLRLFPLSKYSAWVGTILVRMVIAGSWLCLGEWSHRLL